MLHFTGDIHGDQSRFYAPELCPGGPLKKGDHLVVCGDFGLIFWNDKTESNFLDDLEKLPYTLLFVDGNHENFPAIYQYPVVEWNGGKVHKIRENVLHLMRGEVFEIDGKTLFVMGGAYSIDKWRRREGETWWPQELPCDTEYKNATENLKKHNFKVDYIATHTLPQTMIREMGYIPDPHDAELTGFLDWVMHETDFGHWYCGHWHGDEDINEKFTVLWFDVKKA